jgi:hypothetical protein
LSGWRRPLDGFLESAGEFGDRGATARLRAQVLSTHRQQSVKVVRRIEWRNALAQKFEDGFSAHRC